MPATSRLVEKTTSISCLFRFTLSLVCVFFLFLYLISYSLDPHSPKNKNISLCRLNKRGMQCEQKKKRIHKRDSRASNLHLDFHDIKGCGSSNRAFSSRVKLLRTILDGFA